MALLYRRGYGEGVEIARADELLLLVHGCCGLEGIKVVVLEGIPRYIEQYFFLSLLLRERQSEWESDRERGRESQVGSAWCGTRDHNLSRNQESDA